VGILREKLKEKIRRMRSVLGMEMPEHYTLFNKSWRGISAETFNKFQAFYHTDPRYRGRVNFPIRDNSGRILVIQGRDEGNTLKQKYLFTPADAKIPLFPTVQPIQGKIILVEGIFDMLNLHDKGLTNAVCCFGTHHFTKAKLNLLKVSGVTGIDVVFDADDSGKKAAEKIRKIVEDFPIRVVNLKKGDPAELAEQQVKNLRRKLYE
ncbi:MAG: toprim domain-containing protein, partial [Pelagibacteraceae bacterium]